MVRFTKSYFYINIVKLHSYESIFLTNSISAVTYLKVFLRPLLHMFTNVDLFLPETIFGHPGLIHSFLYTLFS